MATTSWQRRTTVLLATMVTVAVGFASPGVAAPAPASEATKVTAGKTEIKTATVIEGTAGKATTKTVPDTRSGMSADPIQVTCPVYNSAYVIFFDNGDGVYGPGDTTLVHWPFTVEWCYPIDNNATTLPVVFYQATEGAVWINRAYQVSVGGALNRNTTRRWILNGFAEVVTTQFSGRQFTIALWLPGPIGSPVYYYFHPINELTVDGFGNAGGCDRQVYPSGCPL
ncbi:hypothetical protein ABZ738_27755 [Micromonospora sp. NPDC047793]|uniref:hypothetical protein n=1 Tax=unclassified Micromonospora TaxID=2617518 RepID=UPI00103535AB|nr:hypothetical protein [Verrucosispora sp. SN26_14.1]TBL37169.1 hypothetical protein EYA84_11065 [Verrucosispora sp. SN26_14.1]